MENHHFQWVNPLFLWQFSIAFCMFTTGYVFHKVPRIPTEFRWFPVQPSVSWTYHESGVYPLSDCTVTVTQHATRFHVQSLSDCPCSSRKLGFDLYIRVIIPIRSQRFKIFPNMFSYNKLTNNTENPPYRSWSRETIVAFGMFVGR